jgi:hypothetical protein
MSVVWSPCFGNDHDLCEGNGDVEDEFDDEIEIEGAFEDGPAAFEPPPPEAVAWFKSLTS